MAGVRTVSFHWSAALDFKKNYIHNTDKSLSRGLFHFLQDIRTTPSLFETISGNGRPWVMRLLLGSISIILYHIDQARPPI